METIEKIFLLALLSQLLGTFPKSAFPQPSEKLVATFTGEDFNLLYGSNFGTSVSTAGDVNNDGIDDLIVGSFAERAYIFYGGNLSGDTPANQADVILFGEELGGNSLDLFGSSVSHAGDFNNDGISDIIVGASNAGRAYIFFGGSLPDSLDGSQADVIFTSESSSSLFGGSVSFAGDVNNDGFDDVIIGDVKINNWTGKAYIFFGDNFSGIIGGDQADVIVDGASSNQRLGQTVSTAGDFNFDGNDDVIIGTNGGNAYIFYGGSLSGTTSANNADVIIIGSSVDTHDQVSLGGDINGDGFSDVIVSGSWNFSTSAFIFYGGNLSGTLFTQMSDVKLTGVGKFVSSAGDINGDNISDVIVGYSNINKAHIYLGGNISGTIPNNEADIILTGENPGDVFGISVASAGDVDNDGIDDVIIGASANDAGGNNVGRAYVYKLQGISMFRPKGGEFWAGGQIQQINWGTIGIQANNIKLLYSTDGGASTYLTKYSIFIIFWHYAKKTAQNRNQV